MRIDTPALLDSAARAALQSMNDALVGLDEAIQATTSAPLSSPYHATNGHVITIHTASWFQSMDEDGSIEVMLPSRWQGSAPPAPNSWLEPLLMGEYPLASQPSSPYQISLPTDVTTVVLSVGLLQPPSLVLNGSVSNMGRMIPMEVTTPCGTREIDILFDWVIGHPLQRKVSLFIEGHEIPASFQNSVTPTSSIIDDGVLVFDTKGRLEIGEEAFLSLNSGDLSSYLQNEGCPVESTQNWHLSIVLQKQAVMLVGEQFPFNNIMSDTPYRELSIQEISLEGQTLFARYDDGTSLKIGQINFEYSPASQGEFIRTDKPLDLAIMGEGFFVFSSSTTNHVRTYSRFGALRLDEEGRIINSKGDFLQVYPTDDAGIVVPTDINSTVALRFPKVACAPKITSMIALKTNLPYDVSPLNLDNFDRNQPNTYSTSSSINIHDAQGNTYIAVLYFIRDESAENQWGMYLEIEGRHMRFDDGNSIPLDYVTFAFDSSGMLDTTSFHPSSFRTFRESEFDHSVQIDLTGSTTEEAPFLINTFEQDGSGTEIYTGPYFDPTGIVYAHEASGHLIALGKIALARFPNPQLLTPTGNHSWLESPGSGQAQLGEATKAGLGYIQSGVLRVIDERY